jgi:hypothetical protein
MSARLLAIALLAVGCSGPASGQTPEGEAPVDFEAWPELEALQAATGDDYVGLRDQALEALRAEGDAGVAAVERAGVYTEHADGVTATHARILLGWNTHAALYRQVLQELEAVDFEHARKTASGIAGVWDDFAFAAADEWQTAVLPLCWEVLLKRQDDWPDWQVVTFLRMVAAVPDVRSRPAVAWLAEHGKESLRRDAREALAKLPQEEAAGQGR